MPTVRTVSPEQVRDAAARLEAVLLETKRWDQTSWLDTVNRGTPEQPMIEHGREQDAQRWIGDQRTILARYSDWVSGWTRSGSKTRWPRPAAPSR